MKYFKTLLGSLFIIAIFFSWGCSLKATPAPATPFLSHGEKLDPRPEHLKWDGVWSSEPSHIAALNDQIRRVFVDEVEIQYLNRKQNNDGSWSGDAGLAPEEILTVTNQLREEFINQIKNHPESNLQLIDQPSNDSITLKIALTELVPTKVALNTIADVGGLLLPGASLIENAGVAGAQAASGAVSGGSIAIEIKLVEAQSLASLFEAKDRESDPASVLPNYRDFERFGWSRRTCQIWAKEFVEAFSTAPDKKIKEQSHFSLLPW